MFRYRRRHDRSRPATTRGGGVRAGFRSSTTVHLPKSLLPLQNSKDKRLDKTEGRHEATLPIYPKALRFARDEEVASVGHEGATKDI